MSDYVAVTLAVAKKELRIAFLSPVAWVFLAAALFLGGLFFYMSLALSGEASMRSALSNLAVLMLFCLPMVTMRAFAEEARSGTLELVLTAPVPLTALILGKWLAVLAQCVVLLAATLVWPATLFVFGNPDPGLVFTSYLGLFACCAAFSAAGLFVSALTRDQMVAAVGTVMLLVPSWVANVGRDAAPAWLAGVLDRISFLDHLRGFARGVIDTADLGWFAVVVGLFLFLTWQTLESRRWR